MIGELVALARGVLKFDSATYAAHVASRDALKRGLVLLAIVALLAGLFPFLGSLVGSFQSPQAEIARAQAEFERQFNQQLQSNPSLRDPQFQQMFQGIMREAFGIARDIVQLKSNISFLPGWLDRVLQALGQWLSQPLIWLGAWAWYALWVTLFAKLLGGRAMLERMLAATSLFVVPHVLDLIGGLLTLLSGIQVAGACFGLLNTLVGFVAWAWGIAVYVKATAAANEFSLGKATLATILPVLLVVLLAMLLASVAVIGIVVSAAGTR
jgi:hypothetical protein